MPHQESSAAFDRPLHTGNGWGGERAGAGRKSGPAYEKSTDQKNLDSARARHESVKADLATLELRERQGELVQRAAVKQAAATILATLAQGLRSIPDNLERKLNASPQITEAVGREIDTILNDLADSLAMLSEAPPLVDD